MQANMISMCGYRMVNQKDSRDGCKLTGYLCVDTE